MSGDDEADGRDSPGLVARLRAWLGSLVGGDGSAETTSDTEPPGAGDASTSETSPTEPTPAPYVCTVCGTDVSDPAGGCPLCGSSDVRERNAPAERDEAEEAGVEPTATATESTVDDEASRLRELRGGSTDAGATTGDEGGADETE
jgi:hypothetical protein